MSEPRKVVIVTGGGSGIGRAVAVKLGAAGYRVALAGRRMDALAETAKRISDAGGTAFAIPTDIADEHEVHQLFVETIGRFGRVDVVFNNAGISASAATIDELEVETWRRVVDVNLTGAFLCAREAFAAMRSQSPRGGRIINNGSISAQAPRPLSAAYTATKHAMTGLTKSISLDGRAFDIACSQIDIGNAATELTDAMAAGILQPSGTTLAEPRFDVGHVADAVAYIAELPLDANVLFMTLMATKMPLTGRG